MRRQYPFLQNNPTHQWSPLWCSGVAQVFLWGDFLMLLLGIAGYWIPLNPYKPFSPPSLFQSISIHHSHSQNFATNLHSLDALHRLMTLSSSWLAHHPTSLLSPLSEHSDPLGHSCPNCPESPTNPFKKNHNTLVFPRQLALWNIWKTKTGTSNKVFVTEHEYACIFCNTLPEETWSYIAEAGY